MQTAKSYSDSIAPIFAPWPYFGPDEIEAAVEVLRSGKVNYWTGEEGRLFEQEFAKKIGCKHAIALTNGSVALELALHALGIGVGDEVIVTPRTFIASASCVIMRGATPVFADVNEYSQNIDAGTIEAVMTPRTKAIIPVHLAGWPCDMDPILALTQAHGLKVIEDCAQAQGARYKGRPVGTMGDFGAFSFCNDKIMTTGGEGGMLTCNDTQLWEKAWAFKDHGKSYKTVHDCRQQSPGFFKWLHESFGTNWRMTEMQSAIGRTALRKVDDWVNTRRRHADILSTGFAKIPALRVTAPPEDIYHSYYKYYVFILPERLKPGWDQNRIIIEISQRDIPCFMGICSEVYREKAFANSGLQPLTRLPVAKRLGETALMFLVHPTLSEMALHYTVQVVKDVFHHAST